MSDLTEKEAELRKIKEQKRNSNKKYYENKKLNEIKEEKEPENKILETENKNKNNIIETSCQTEEQTKESDAWNEWWWNTVSGTGSMILQTLIQSLATIAVPAILMYLIPRQSITSSAQQSKPHTRDTQPQITSLSSL